ncbi:MAG: DUF4363 family protein [Oscillospiraceae bacterium]
MNRLITISAILFSILTVSIVSIAYAKNANDKIFVKISGIEANANEKSDTLLSSITDLSEYWHKKERFLSTFVRHDEIEKVNLSLSKIKKLAEVEMFGELKIELEQIRFFVDHILNRELPTYENIF